MSYCFPSRDRALFTENQKERMRASLTVLPRISLLSSNACSPPIVYNLSLQDVIAPDSVICDSLFKPTLQVKNLSNVPVTSFKVNGSLNSVAISTFNWAGTLAVDSIITFPIQQLKASKGNNLLDVTISAPNNKSDVDSLDNKRSKSFRFSSTAVSLEPLDKSCLDGALISLAGGTPEGGVFSGPGVSSNVFDPNAAGLGTHKIYYTFTNAENCTAKDSSTILVETCTGIVDVASKGFQAKLYPNPTKGWISLNLHSETQRKITFEILNMIGQSVYKESINLENQLLKTIDMTSYPNGSYLFTFQIDDRKASIQVLVAK
jgi:hypothetical protein